MFNISYRYKTNENCKSNRNTPLQHRETLNHCSHGERPTLELHCRLAEKSASGGAAVRKAARKTGISAQILDALPKNRPLSALGCARRHGLPGATIDLRRFSPKGAVRYSGRMLIFVFDKSIFNGHIQAHPN